MRTALGICCLGASPDAEPGCRFAVVAVEVEDTDSSGSVDLSVELYDPELLSDSVHTGQTPNCPLEVTIDSVRPEVVSISWSQENQTTLSDLELTVVLSEPVRSFEALAFGVGALALSPGLIVNSIMPVGEDGLSYTVQVSRSPKPYTRPTTAHPKQSQAW